MIGERVFFALSCLVVQSDEDPNLGRPKEMTGRKIAQPFADERMG
jgi:hypothetical protein